MSALTPLHWCGAVTVETRDALGRPRLRCPDCHGIGEAGATQPRRPITQHPGAPAIAGRTTPVQPVALPAGPRFAFLCDESPPDTRRSVLGFGELA